MKFIQFNDNNTVVDIRSVSDTATIDKCAIVEGIPTYEPKDGYSGILKHDASTGLYWEYSLNPSDEDDLSDTEFREMVEGAL